MAEGTKREIGTILDQHDEAFRAVREASHGFDAAMDGLRTTLKAVRAANRAQAAAIDAFRQPLRPATQTN